MAKVILLVAEFVCARKGNEWSAYFIKLWHTNAHRAVSQMIKLGKEGDGY